jgi:hypothetical protein
LTTAVAEARTFTLPARSIAWSATPKTYDTEADSGFIYTDSSFKAEETVFVLLNVWESVWNDGLAKRIDENVRTKLKPALDRARTLGLHVVHIPHLESVGPVYGYKRHPLVEVLPGEDVLHGDLSNFDAYLKGKGIKQLIYVGYASNICLVDRDVRPFRLRELGYRTLLMRDASLAVETKEFPIGTVHEVIMTLYDAAGGTISVDGFLAAHVE